MNVWDWHDRVFLWWLQELVYAHQIPAACVGCAVLLALPAHRRLANTVRWCFLAVGLICLARYNALEQAPLLAFSFLAAASYLALRWLLWRLPQHVVAQPLLGGISWLRPHAVWARALVRDYLRADPRCVYWLDLARAVRRLPMTRTARDRRDSVASADFLPGVRRACWRILFWLVETRIQLYCRLPAYWHDPQRSFCSERPLELKEPYPRNILEDEQEVAYQRMLESWTGRDFADYCRRDAIARQEAARQAVFWGRKNILHREALAECWIYRTPWPAGERTLVQAAWRIIASWRHRRQYDFLWDPETDSTPEPTEPPAPPAPPLAPQSPTEPHAEIEDASAPSLTFGADSVEPAAEAAVGERSDIGQQDDETAEVDKSDEDDEDDELFRLASPTVEAAGQSPGSGPTRNRFTDLTDRVRFRLEDLQLASRLLEAYLGITATAEFAHDVELVEPYLDRSRHVTGAAMLLLLYCLRPDYAGRDTDRRKVDLILRLSDRFREAPKSGPYHEARQVVRSLQFDWLTEREDYSQLVAGLDAHSNLSVYEWKLLADAEAALAQQLSGQPELRDDIRHDAIDHYFQAGFRGLWTVTYAKKLLGPLAGLDDLVDLLRAHSVEVTPSSALTVAEAVQQPGKTPPVGPDMPPPVRHRVRRARKP